MGILKFSIFLRAFSTFSLGPLPLFNKEELAMAIKESSSVETKRMSTVITFYFQPL
jgi:hypothetical protein